MFQSGCESGTPAFSGGQCKKLMDWELVSHGLETLSSVRRPSPGVIYYWCKLFATCESAVARCPTTAIPASGMFEMSH
jgi:hypothetical protein